MIHADKWNNPLCVSQKSIDEKQDSFLKTGIETSYSSNGSLMGSIVDESLLQRAAAEFVKIGHLDHSQGEWMKDDIHVIYQVLNF